LQTPLFLFDGAESFAEKERVSAIKGLEGERTCASFNESKESLRPHVFFVF
jgi:hypothetical protein